MKKGKPVVPPQGTKEKIIGFVRKKLRLKISIKKMDDTANFYHQQPHVDDHHFHPDHAIH